jgi:hypothetical protein
MAEGRATGGLGQAPVSRRCEKARCAVKRRRNGGSGKSS